MPDKSPKSASAPAQELEALRDIIRSSPKLQDMVLEKMRELRHESQLTIIDKAAEHHDKKQGKGRKV